MPIGIQNHILLLIMVIPIQAEVLPQQLVTITNRVLWQQMAFQKLGIVGMVGGQLQVEEHGIQQV